jgi:hypothetical protein
MILKSARQTHTIFRCLVSPNMRKVSSSDWNLSMFDINKNTDVIDARTTTHKPYNVTNDVARMLSEVMPRPRITAMKVGKANNRLKIVDVVPLDCTP